MAKRVEEITLGVDVSKDRLDVHEWETGRDWRIDNDRQAIEALFRSLDAPARLAVEATSDFHLRLVELAIERGARVFLINPRALAAYREAVELRNKTDREDARLLARYLAHEGACLRPFKPRDARAQELWALLKRRAVVVGARQQLEQSFRQVRFSSRRLVTETERLLARIDRRLRELLEALGWMADYRRCKSIPGVGELNAIALTASFHRGAFGGSDTFVAFLGLDIRLRESGRYKGQSKLSKRGESEVRRLLYCAAQPARSHRPFDNYYQRQIEKGLSKIAAKVALARKIARIAFTLLTRQESFRIQPLAT